MMSYQKKIEKDRKSTFFYRMIIIAVSLVISLGLSKNSLLRKFDNIFLNFLFVVRGESQPHSNLILVLADDETRNKIGDAPYSRDVFVTLIEGLQKTNAKVIGLDFRFVKEQSKERDTLLVKIAQKYDNLVFGCYFQKVYEPDHDRDDTRFTPFQGDYLSLPFDRLMKVIKYIGHFNMFIENVDGMTRTIPLFISYGGINYPAFALELVTTYWGVERDQIKLKHDRVNLLRRQNIPVEIPILKWSEYPINFIGGEENFYHYYSLHEVMEYFQNPKSESMDHIGEDIFKDKIVLIGSLIDEDWFTVPFSVQFPGILIHATIIDNILKHDFIIKADHITYLGITVVLLLLMITTHFLKPVLQPFIFIGFIVTYGSISILLFKYFNIILTEVYPVIWILLSGTGLTILNFNQISIHNQYLKNLLQDQSNKMVVFANKMYGYSQDIHIIRLFITLVHLQNRCLILAWIQENEDRNEFIPSLMQRTSRHPISLKIHEFNRIRLSEERMWYDYAHYMVNDEKSEIKPIERLQEIGRKVYQNFSLEATFKSLFNCKDSEFYLTFILDDTRIPWYWAFSPMHNEFLDHQYPIGVSFMRTEPTKVPKTVSANSVQSAILFFGDWRNDSHKRLSGAGSEIQSLKKKLQKQGIKSVVTKDDVAEFLNICGVTIEDGYNLRIIHYVGHAEKDYLDVAPGQTLMPGMLKEMKDLFFRSRPLVFLNACQSAQIGSPWYPYQNLITEFLACGAGACIATIGDVAEITSKRFSSIFYRYFIDEKVSAGEALRRTKITLSRPEKNYDPDYDITRCFYVLYGDPTVSF